MYLLLVLSICSAERVKHIGSRAQSLTHTHSFGSGIQTHMHTATHTHTKSSTSMGHFHPLSCCGMCTIPGLCTSMCVYVMISCGVCCCRCCCWPLLLWWASAFIRCHIYLFIFFFHFLFLFIWCVWHNRFTAHCTREFISILQQTE